MFNKREQKWGETVLSPCFRGKNSNIKWVGTVNWDRIYRERKKDKQRDDRRRETGL